MELTEEQFHRYARNMILDEIGEEGQEKLLDARVLVVGAGGLGAPLILYLAAAGIGTIGIVDDDTVDMTNPAAPGRPRDRPCRPAEGGERGGHRRRAQSGRPGRAL